MISRRRVIKTGAIGIALATLPFDRIPRALGQSAAAFDYYISPTGDDNNAGTLSSPWSITALNSKQSTYAGKHIGLIAGTYRYGTVGGKQTTLYSMYQALTDIEAVILALQGGPSSSQPTYLASCDSSGSYSARAAIIDCSDPSTGDLPTVSGAVLGQYSYRGSNVTQYGNVTVDGIVIRNWTFSALLFQGTSAQSFSGLIIKNCEIYNGQNIISNNNPGAIWLQFSLGAAVTNCLVHDLQSNGPGTSFSLQLLGFIQFNSFGTNVTNCTFYNCSAVSNKDGWQNLNVSYCYLGWGTFGNGYAHTQSPHSYGATVQNYLTGAAYTNYFHHNIVLGGIYSQGESANQPNQGVVVLYNNTFYQPDHSGYSPLFAITNIADEYAATGSWRWYNNLVWSDADKYEDGDYACAALDLGGATSSPSLLTQCNYNAYGAGMTFNGATTGNHWPIATWQGHGFDLNSTTLIKTPFSGTPAEANYKSFAVTGPAATAGMGGVPCGAVDGSGLVGCDFVGEAVPTPPTLSLG